MTFDINSILIARKLRQIENDVANLAWRSFNSVTVFDDVMIDNLSSSSNINNSLSYYLFDSVTGRAKKSISNLTLVTNTWNLSSSLVSSTYCIIEIVPVSPSFTPKIDIAASISFDNGLSYYRFENFYLLWNFQTFSTCYLRGDISDIQNTGSQVVFKIETFNNINLQISAYSVGVRF